MGEFWVSGVNVSHKELTLVGFFQEAGFRECCSRRPDFWEGRRRGTLGTLVYT
jgi:hypothetical protein